MQTSGLILIAGAFAAYLLVLWVHSIRHPVGLSPFYALLGGLTAVMSWVTDAGVRVQVGDLTFMVGSTVFYTAILLGVFVVYVFDGPGPTRIAILSVAGISALTPVVAVLIHAQMSAIGDTSVLSIPMPSLRVNSASVLATTMDLLFLAVAWEFIGTPRFKIKTWLRTFLTLLGVMWLDVVLFATGAFAGTPDYLAIMGGTFTTRLIIAACASPLLFLYLSHENKRTGESIERRPVLAIFKEVAETRAELAIARLEIERRKAAERELESHRRHLEELVAERTHDLVQTNEELREANETKQVFLAKMSHELRTPLNSVIGFSDVLVRGMAGPLNDEQAKQVGMINRSGKHLLSLINDVLDLSRLDAEKVSVRLESFDPAAIVAEVAEIVRPMAEEKGLRIEIQDHGCSGATTSDPGKVKQILLNLVGNAVKFSESGDIGIELRCDPAGGILVAVHDSGPGIPEEDLPRVFEAFTQLEVPGAVASDGTGLGLTVSQRHAELLGGEIVVESSVETGSTFTLYVPDKG